MNITLITDINGDTTDINTYCSDYCAQTDPFYEGWYGCVENDLDFVCLNCGQPA